MNKDDYIIILSKESDRYGNLLMQMMDKYKVNSLKELSFEQVKEFYEERKTICKEKNTRN